MSRDNRSTRRQFFERSLTSMSAMAAMMATPRGAAAAAANMQQRRHLITIMPAGPAGWDTTSFFSGVNPEINSAILTNPEVTYEALQVSPRWHNRSWSGNTTQFGYRHPNYTGSGESDVWMAPGMSVFPNKMLAEDILIWHGLDWRDGGHEVGTLIMNGGMRTRYAASFSQLVAENLAARVSPLELNYVHIAPPNGSRGALTTNAGNGVRGGFGSPIAIPDAGAWRSLTTPSSTDLFQGKRDLLSGAVNDLASSLAGNELKLKSSKSLFSSFLTYFMGAQSLGTSNFGSDVGEFADLWANYRTEVLADVTSHGYFQYYKDKYGGGATYDVSGITFRFALAEFLVRKCKAWVVDLPGAFVDGHEDNANERIGLLATMACYRRLLAGLKATETSPGSGKSLLDITTVVMFTEFDRSPYLSFSANGPNNNPGTGHGVSASVLMAGAGVRGGKVVGGLKQGDANGFHKAFSQEFYHPLPIDLSTGRPSPSGKLAYIENFFPTMCSLMNVSLPAQQQTQDGPIPLVIKS
jgi:hypothetical protein